MIWLAIDSTSRPLNTERGLAFGVLVVLIVGYDLMKRRYQPMQPPDGAEAAQRPLEAFSLMTEFNLKGFTVYTKVLRFQMKVRELTGHR